MHPRRLRLLETERRARGEPVREVEARSRPSRDCSSWGHPSRLLSDPFGCRPSRERRPGSGQRCLGAADVLTPSAPGDSAGTQGQDGQVDRHRRPLSLGAGVLRSGCCPRPLLRCGTTHEPDDQRDRRLPLPESAVGSGEDLQRADPLRSSWDESGSSLGPRSAHAATAPANNVVLRKRKPRGRSQPAQTMLSRAGS